MAERAPFYMSKAYARNADARSGLHRIEQNPNETEHIQGVEHLIAYLEPLGEERHRVQSREKTWTTGEIRQHAVQLHRDIGSTPLSPSLVEKLPKPVHPSDTEQTNQQPLNYFNINIWAWEPYLLDDLERAKTKKLSQQTNELRKMIRSGSWDTHARTNEEGARKLAMNWYKELKQHPQDAQLEFTELMNPHLDMVEKLVELLSSKPKPDCGDTVEPMARFIEDQLQQAWLRFMECYRETSTHFRKEVKKYGDRFSEFPLDWPHSRFHIEIPPSVTGTESGHLYDFSELYQSYQRIIDLRRLRDQVYYHLLYPRLCSFIKPSKSATNV